jgi:hypothetical protein
VGHRKCTDLSSIMAMKRKIDSARSLLIGAHLKTDWTTYYHRPKWDVDRNCKTLGSIMFLIVRLNCFERSNERWDLRIQATFGTFWIRIDRPLLQRS